MHVHVRIVYNAIVHHRNIYENTNKKGSKFAITKMHRNCPIP